MGRGGVVRALMATEELTARLGAEGDSCMESREGAFDEPQLVMAQTATEVRTGQSASAFFISLNLPALTMPSSYA